ncbi:MAG TPA: type 1 glutamine amidotransferase [Spirochaetales bacterium]|nr:type 1 glutamine amidotransferase [Spirochaetales bacterium]HRY56491.1 type 1 glutamine amidotransferase [Spirochaetia bacterium]HRZ65558.1 type 1 glutamine amidotransferase [Spirochaetia bacterium]
MRVLQVLHRKPAFELNNAGFFSRRGDEVSSFLCFAGEPAPDPRELDAVIVYGGFMSAYDDAGHPWIASELRFLEQCMDAGLPILGICLGSQLLARLLGARVYASPAPEFGFKRISLTPEGLADPVLGALGRDPASPGSFLGLEWHSDAWDLPAGAARLARSGAWENEAFRYGPGVLAIQFHLEYTQLQIAANLAKGGSDLPADPEAEDPASFAAPGPRYDEIKRSMERLLEGFLAGAGR